MIIDFTEIYRFREVIKNFVILDLKVKYRRSVLGFFWSLLNPLFTMIILAFVFSVVFRINLKNYSLYLIAGLLPWQAFASSVNAACDSIVDAEGYIKKNYFPKFIFPLSIVLANMVNYLLATCVMFLIGIFLGMKINICLFVIPFSMAILFFFTVGVAAIVSTVNVFFRDMKYIIGIIVQLWFYITPILIPLDIIPLSIQPIFFLNPLTYVIDLFIFPIYHSQIPTTSHFIYASAIAGITLIFGLRLFAKHEDEFVFRL